MQSDLSFRLMAAEFRLRDWWRPPAKILREAGVRPMMTVLDFGCGPGGFALAAARLVGPRGRVYALDINPLAIRSVSRASARKGYRNIHLLHGANTDSLDDHSVDFAILYDILHGIPNPAPILGEIHRVLKAEGVLSVSDHHLKQNSLQKIVEDSGFFRLAECNLRICQFRGTVSGKEAI